MTAERFGELLRRPYLLSGQNATEIEELIAAYPWSGPLRRLRYAKAVVDGNPEELRLWRERTEPFLARGLSREDALPVRPESPVRAQRHFGFADDAEVDRQPAVPAASDLTPAAPEPDSGATTDDTVPTTVASDAVPTSVASDAVPTTVASDAVPRTVASDAAAPPAHDDPSAGEESRAETLSDDRPLVGDPPGGPPPDRRAALRDTTRTGAAAVVVAEWYLQRNGLIMDYGRPQPTPIETLRSYREWKQRRAQTSWQDLLLLGLEGVPAGKSAKARRDVGSAEPEVASETLADLLARQGHHEKAIRMYRQLSLRHPSKIDTFAARIQALQQTQA